MKTRSLIHSILAAASLASGSASAEDLKDVYELALDNDPLIREAEANRRAARESRPQAFAALLPQLNADARYAEDESDGSQTFLQEDPATGGVIIGTAQRETDSTTTNWSVTLRQNLFRWQNWATLRRANAEGAQAEADYLAVQQDLILRTATAYFNVLAAQDTVEAAQAAHDAIARQLEQSEKRFEVGLIAVTDVQEAKAAYDSAVAALIAAKRTLATSGEQLRELTGSTFDELTRPGSEMPLSGPNPANAEDWVQLAMEQNARLNSSRIAAEITRHNIGIERGGHYPELDLVVTRGEFDVDGDFITDDGDRFPQDADSEDTTIGLQVTVPIFSGGATSSRVRQAQYRHIAARERLERTARETERATRDAYLGVSSEMARVQSLKQAVQSAMTALQATEAGYEVGTRTSVDVLQARQRLFEAQTNYARSRYDYLLNVLQLQLAAGTLDAKGLTDINALLTENVAVR